MRSATPIRSRQHPLVRRCRALARRRDGGDAVLLDGEHLLEDALAAGVTVEFLLTSRPALPVVEHARLNGVDVHVVPEAVLEAASPVRTPSGILGVAHWQPAPIDRLVTATQPLIVGLVDVQDPGNVGSAIRSADALGATGVALLDASADPAGWKALRAAMGSTFRLPVARTSSETAMIAARRARIRVLATRAGGGTAVDQVDLFAPALVMFGSEGSGLSETIRQRVDGQLTIPMRPGANSLNVAVTVALVLEAARRQRTGASR